MNPTVSEIEAQLSVALSHMRKILKTARHAKFYSLVLHHFSLFISAFWSIYTMAQLSRTELLSAIAGLLAAIVSWQVAQFFRRQAIGYSDFITEAEADLQRILKRIKVDILKP